MHLYIYICRNRHLYIHRSTYQKYRPTRLLSLTNFFPSFTRDLSLKFSHTFSLCLYVSVALDVALSRCFSVSLSLCLFLSLFLSLWHTPVYEKCRHWPWARAWQFQTSPSPACAYVCAYVWMCVCHIHIISCTCVCDRDRETHTHLPHPVCTCVWERGCRCVCVRGRTNFFSFTLHAFNFWIFQAIQRKRVCVRESECVRERRLLQSKGWRRPIGCLKVQVIFRKRATNCRALLRKMAYGDKASYRSTPPCTTCMGWLQVVGSLKW